MAVRIRGWDKQSRQWIVSGNPVKSGGGKVYSTNSVAVFRR